MTPYYEDDAVTIYHGDALDVLPRIDTATILALDPPYSMVPNSPRGKDDGAAGTSGTPIRLLNETLRHTRRLLPDGGCAGLICDWRRMGDAAYLATLNGLRITTCVAWIRTTPGMGGIFRSAWDPMLVLSVGTPDTIDRAAIRNVHAAEKPSASEHPYEKPSSLWAHLFSRLPSGVVVDPFMGTGASMVAARTCGHRAIGIETDERYCEIAAKRMGQGVLPL